MSNTQDFSKWLSTILKKEKISQSKLAKASGVARPQINAYVRGKCAPGIKNRKAIEKALKNPAELRDSVRAPGRHASEGEFQRVFGGLTVRDAKDAIRLTIMPEDVNPAARKDPGHCALASGCQRQFGSKTVMFYKTLAYIEIPDDNGARIVERFMLSPAASAIVEKFDLGEDVPTDGRLLTLLPPTPGKTLEHSRKAKRARMKGEYKSPIRRAAAAKAAKTRASKPPIDVRSGTGQVQMVPAK